MASIVKSEHQIMTFLKEHKPIECGCCGDVFGFQHKTTGVFICTVGCHETHQRNSEVNRNGEASPPAHSPTPPPLKKTSVVPSVAAAVSRALLSSQTNAVHNQQKVHLVRDEKSIEEQPQSRPIKEVTTSNDVNLNPKPRQERTQQSHPIKKTVTLDSVDSAVKSQPGLAKPAVGAVAVVPSTSMNGMTPPTKTSGTEMVAKTKPKLWTEYRYSKNLATMQKVGLKFHWNPVTFHIVATSDEAALAKLQSDIGDYVSTAAPIGRLPVIDEIVIATYEEDCYRARVTAVREEECDVTFVDYGDKQTCPLNEIYEMDPALAKSPIYGMTVRLERVPLPCDYTLDSNLEEQFYSQHYIVDFCDPGKLVPNQTAFAEVKLWNQEKTNTLNKLVSNSIASQIPGSQPEQKLTSKNTGPDTGGKTNLWSQCRYSPNLNSNVNIKVQFAWSPIRYLIVAEEDDDALFNFQEKVKEHVLKGKRLAQLPSVNEIVIGEYDESYYRGRVTKVEGEICTVSFVDYGDKTVCSFRKLFAVDAELMQYPIYGMTIQLEKVEIPSNFQLPDEMDEMLYAEIFTLDLVIGRRPQLGEAGYFEARLWPSTGSFSLNTKVRDAVAAAKRL